MNNRYIRRMFVAVLEDRNVIFGHDFHTPVISYQFLLPFTSVLICLR